MLNEGVSIIWFLFEIRNVMDLCTYVLLTSTFGFYTLATPLKINNIHA